MNAPDMLVNNSYMDRDATYYGSKIKYTCQDGYIFPDGAKIKTIQCLENRKWSFMPQHCEGEPNIKLKVYQKYICKTFYQRVRYKVTYSLAPKLVFLHQAIFEYIPGKNCLTSCSTEMPSAWNAKCHICARRR